MAWVSLASMPGREFRKGKITYWKILDGMVWHQRRKLRKADADSFEVRPTDHRFIGRDQRAIYFASSEVSSADRDTFEVLGDNYFRDASTGFFEFETSLRPLKGGKAGQFENVGGGYARDAAYGYYAGKPLRNCTIPLSLTSVAADPVYAKDDVNVYFDGSSLKSVDATTWRLFEATGFSGDHQNVYYGAKKLPRVDLSRWRHVTEGYSRDDQRIYHWHYQLKHVDLATWQPVDRHYSKDEQRIYYFGTEVEGGDAASFAVDESGHACDQHGAIEYGRRAD